MKRLILLAGILCAGRSGAFAAAYFQQASFPVPYASVAGADRDSLGNLYVLGLPASGASYQVSGFQTPGMSPLFSFDTGVSSPVAFAVESSGIIDILDASSTTVTLKRFQNTGAFIGQISYPLMTSIYDNPKTLFSAAIDKTNGFVYLAYQQWRSYLCLMCLGCGCPPNGYKGYLNQYDFSGNLLRTVTMPGVSATYSSCYTPSSLATDPQGNIFVADNTCQQLFKYSETGTLLNTFSPPSWTSNYYVTVRGMWSDAQSNLYISQPVCGPSGCQPGIVKLDEMANIQAKVTADSPMGCAWDDRILYLNSSGASPLRRFIFNGVPSVPSEIAPIGPVIQHSSSAALSWQSSGDPDGDTLTYYVSLGATPTQLSPIGDTMQTDFNTAPLAFEATYYWQVVAVDSYMGIPLQQQPAPVVSARLSLQNSPPGAFGVVSGTGTVVTRASTALLSWQTAIDPDGDPVVYDVLWRSTSQPTATIIATIPQRSLQVNGLSFGTTYYWSVKARDVYNASRFLAGGAEQPYYLAFENSPPASLSVLTGAGAVTTRNTAQILSWQATTDPDGDLVTYELSLSTDSNVMPIVQSSTATSFALPFQFGATYFWQVTARDGFGGAASPGLQTFLPVFRNSPPTVPVNQSQTGTILHHGFTPSLSFFWQPSTDPDGDPFTYGLYIGTDATNLSVSSPVPLGYTVSNLSVNTPYYYKIAATDSYGAASASPVNWVYYQFSNTPPQPFDVVAATGTIVTRNTTAALAWTLSTDPDDDLLIYRVFAGTAASSLAPLGDTAQPGFLLSGLGFGTTYYWRVDAYDGFGATTTINGGTQSLLQVFKNAPPNSIVYLTTAASLGLHTTSPNVSLSWAPAPDPDGDPVSYRFDMQTSTGAWPSVSMGSSTSFAIGVLFETTYYWRMTASDPYGGASTGAWLSFVAHFANQPPAPFAGLSGSGAVSTRETSQLLSWQSSTDPDGDALTYGLFLSTSPALLPAVRQSTSTTFNLAFQFGTTYYWRVEAYDGFGGTTMVTGGPQSFLPLFLNDPPGQLNLTAPFKGSPVISTMRNKVSVSWQQVSTPQGDPITYAVYFGDSPNSMDVLTHVLQTLSASGMRLASAPAAVGPASQVELDGDTITLTLAGLDYYRSYYLRIVATNPYGSASMTPIQTFSLNPQNGFPRAYNYPNPFNPNRGGTHIVFNAPASGYARATVSIYSELQDLLFEKDYMNIPPGISEVIFDGRDRNGRSLFNGSYICRVRFSGPDDKEIFYLLVVK